MDKIYLLAGDDNGSFYCDETDEKIYCKACGFLIDLNYINEKYQVPKMKYDISATYDNRLIVSEKFKDFCLKMKYTGLIFNPIKSNQDFYLLDSSNIVKVDTARTNIEYYNLCDECLKFESITPVLPIVIESKFIPLNIGIYVTDIFFGSGNEIGREYLINQETFDEMQKENFKGFNPTENKILF